MKRLNEKTLKFLEWCITWDLNLTKYQNWSDLVQFFNKFWSNDEYWPWFPSRRHYVNQKLNELNWTSVIYEIMTDMFNPINFIWNEWYKSIIQSLNEYLYYDDLVLELDWKRSIIKDLIDTETSNPSTSHVSVTWIEAIVYDDNYVFQQYSKCKKKLQEKDFDWAITNARTLLEATFWFIYSKIHNKDLPKTWELVWDFKKIKDCLDFTWEQRTDDGLKALCWSISSIIWSIDNLSNSMWDRHRRTIEARPYQAEFIVNSAISLNNYILWVFKFNFHTIDNVLEEIRPLFSKENVYWYYFDINKPDKFNEIHNHPIAIKLKSKLTALKWKEVVKYLIEILDIRSWEASWRFFWTMLLLIDYLTLDDVNTIFDKTIVSFREQAVNLRRFLQNINIKKPHLLGEKQLDWLNILLELNANQLASFVFRPDYELKIEDAKKIWKWKFIASLVAQYYWENDQTLKVIKRLTE